jgi:hypothetical protein
MFRSKKHRPAKNFNPMARKPKKRPVRKALKFSALVGGATLVAGGIAGALKKPNQG